VQSNTTSIFVELVFGDSSMSTLPSGSLWDLFKLDGRNFLVVGGARDLGFDMAEALAQAGADGVVTSRDHTSAELAAKRLSESTGRKVTGLGLDATDETQLRSVTELVLRELGHVDVLVNCVGGGATTLPVELERREMAAVEKMLLANVVAPQMICKHVVPHMRLRKSGSIINIASIAGIVGRDRSVYLEGMSPQALDYASAKGAVIGFTRDLAAYLGADGIRVNTISPGGFARKQPQAFIDAYSAKTPLKRMGRDGVDLKGATIFLASDASAYVTGHNLVVDGGFSIWQ
jgi:NAD(P)-dependent dehydrogenase (short-subunit alcohol dehydrogenase family)